MFKPHVHLENPQNTRQKLWRYIKYERLLKLLESDLLYFPHITTMSDKWEGLLSERTKEKFILSQHSKTQDLFGSKQYVDNYEEFRNEFFINCWHMATHESYLMWKVYGDKGCAIQTTFERLTTSFHESPNEINGGVIKYIDYQRDQVPVGNSYWLVSHKDLPYSDEKEYRLFYWKLSPNNMNLPEENVGVNIHIDTDILIENIYINPLENKDLTELKRIVNDKKLSCKIKQSRIKE